MIDNGAKVYDSAEQLALIDIKNDAHAQENEIHKRVETFNDTDVDITNAMVPQPTGDGDLRVHIVSNYTLPKKPKAKPGAVKPSDDDSEELQADQPSYIDRYDPYNRVKFCDIVLIINYLFGCTFVQYST